MLTKYVWPLITSVLVLLFGVALLVWPFALHTNQGGWSAGTTSDFWSGLGIIIIGILTGLGWYTALQQEMVRRGIIEIRREQPPSPPEPKKPAPSPGKPDDMDIVVRQLAETVLRDLSTQLETKDRRRGGGPVA